MAIDKVYEGDHLRVGDHVWVEKGSVHPDQRLRGTIVKITMSPEWGTPDYHVVFIWPGEQRSDTWKLEGDQLEQVGVIERLAETVEFGESLEQLYRDAIERLATELNG